MIWNLLIAAAVGLPSSTESNVEASQRLRQTLLQVVDLSDRSRRRLQRTWHYLGPDHYPELVAGWLGNLQLPTPPLALRQRNAEQAQHLWQDFVASSCREALAHSDEALLLSFLQASGLAAETDEQRMALIKLLGEIGQGAALTVLLNLAEPADLSVPANRQECDRALRRILERDPGPGLPLLRDRFASLTTPQLQWVLHALLAATGQRGLQFLTQRFGDNAEQDLLILQGLGRAANLKAEAVRAQLEKLAHSALRAQDLKLRIAATEMVAHLGDRSITPLLVDQLGDGHPADLREASEAALDLLLEAACDGEQQWRAWLAEEARWFSEVGTLRLAQLQSEAADAVSAAIRELASRRLYSDRIGPALQRLLQHRSREVQIESCNALAQLRHLAAVGALCDTLLDREPLVRQAAWRALVQITGEKRRNDPAAWRDYRRLGRSQRQGG